MSTNEANGAGAPSVGSEVNMDIADLFHDATNTDIQKASGESDVCCICLSEMELGDVKKLTCDHLLHTRCLCEILEKARTRNAATCPICREPMPEAIALTANDGAMEEEDEVDWHEWLDQQEQERLDAEAEDEQAHHEWLDQQEQERLDAEAEDEQAHHEWLDQQAQESLDAEAEDERAHHEWLDQQEQERLDAEAEDEQAHHEWLDQQEQERLDAEAEDEQAHREWLDQQELEWADTEDADHLAQLEQDMLNVEEVECQAG